MKIIIASPRTGSTFYARYLEQTLPEYTSLDEYFMPFTFPKGSNTFDITTERLAENHDKHIIKIITGNEVDSRVWDWLKESNAPVTILKRKNIERQILSYGASCMSNVWATFEKHAFILSTGYESRPLSDIPSFLKGMYKREWFDKIVERIKMLDYLETVLNVENVLYYEDIIQLEHDKTERIPTIQNNCDDKALLNFFVNKKNVEQWINTIV